MQDDACPKEDDRVGIELVNSIKDWDSEVAAGFSVEGAPGVHYCHDIFGIARVSMRLRDGVDV